jgi:hypothetical protein
MSEESLPVGHMARDDAADAQSQSASRPAAPEPLRFSPTTVAVLVGAVAYAAVAGGFRRLTAPAELATFAAGSLVCWLALRKECRRFPAPDHVDGKGALAWGAVLVVFGIWELYADFRGSTPAHPTLSILMGPVIAPPENRAIGYLAWLAGGVWLVRR